MKIVRVSKAAEALFSSEHRLRVCSIYKNTANLQLGERIFALQTADTQASPFSIETDAADGCMERAFSVGETVRTSARGICAGERLISLPEQYERYDGHFCAGSGLRNFSVQAEILKRVLSCFAPRNSFFAVVEPQRLADCNRYCGAHEAASLAARAKLCRTPASFGQALAELVGLGLGLTPAGDDFIIGVLAALELTEAAQWRRALCASLRFEMTNRISAGFLRAATESEYAQYLLELLKAISDSAAAKETERCALRVVQTGHTSGSDTLSGMLWCMETIERKRENVFLQ